MAQFQSPQVHPVARASADATRAMLPRVPPDRASSMAQGQATRIALPVRHMGALPRAHV